MGGARSAASSRPVSGPGVLVTYTSSLGQVSTDDEGDGEHPISERVGEPAERLELRLLWREVLHARDTFELVRGTQSASGAQPIRAAWADLVTALSGYAARLHARQIPIPYQLRDELRLLRIVDGSQRT
jgi:hypothetical protein